jgi:hypothetical protein
MAWDDEEGGFICQVPGQPHLRAVIGREYLCDHNPASACPICGYELEVDQVVPLGGGYAHQWCVDEQDEPEASEARRASGGTE